MSFVHDKVIRNHCFICFMIFCLFWVRGQIWYLLLHLELKQKFPFTNFRNSNLRKSVKRQEFGINIFKSFIPGARWSTHIPFLSIEVSFYRQTILKHVLRYPKSISLRDNKNMFREPKMSLENLVLRKQNKLNIEKLQWNNNWHSVQCELYHTATETITSNRWTHNQFQIHTWEISNNFAQVFVWT